MRSFIEPLGLQVSVKSAEISPQNLVVRFSESLDGFPLPKGYSENPELQVPSKGD